MAVKLLKESDLTEGQKAALDYMKAFIDGPNREMVLCGAAGTGKTSLVNVLLDQLDEHSFYKYVCTAPTNKAVEVISRNTGKDYDRTIVSLLGLTLRDYDDGEPVLVREPGSESKLGQYDLVIIDEASMVSRKLIGEIERDMLEHDRIKVIYIGDKCQIPPVDDTKTGMMESVVFTLPLICELTQVMRTALDNPILAAVTKMRENMASERDLFEHVTKELDDGSGITFFNDREQFMNKMYETFDDPKYDENTDYCVAVAYRNVSVDAINRVVRKHKYPDVNADFVVGEEVRVKKPYRIRSSSKKDTMVPVYNLEERLKILDVEECNDPAYDLPCYKVEVVNYRAPKSSRDTRTLYVVKRDSISLYTSLLNNTALECKEREQKPGHNGMGHMYSRRDAWRPYNTLKNYYLWVDYIYAMTAHRAQGSTIDNVFVVDRDINLIASNVERNKLKYTAFTRASKHLYVLE